MTAAAGVAALNQDVTDAANAANNAYNEAHEEETLAMLEEMDEAIAAHNEATGDDYGGEVFDQNYVTGATNSHWVGR